MAKRIAQFFFNKFFADFAENYAHSFGSVCTHFRDVVLPNFREVMKANNLETIDNYQNLFLTSFKDPLLVKMLKENNEDLILKREFYNKCTILQHLQLYEIWSKPATRTKPARPGLVMDREKSNIFKYLNGAYCIVSCMKFIPPEVLNSIEREAVNNSSSMASNNSINLTSMKRTGKEMLNHLTNDHIFDIYDYVTEFCLSEYTPLYNLVPETYWPMVANVRACWNNADIREAVVNQIKPILKDIRKHQRIAGLRVVDEENVIESAAGAEGANQIDEGEARSYAVEFFIDLCIGVVEKNQDLITAGARDPSKIKSYLQSGNIIQAVSRLGDEFTAVLKAQPTPAATKTAKMIKANNDDDNASQQNARATSNKKATNQSEPLEMKIHHSSSSAASVPSFASCYTGGGGVYIPDEDDDYFSVQEQ